MRRLCIAVWLLASSACATPAVSSALVVRNLEAKCALIAFSGCPPARREPNPGPVSLAVPEPQR
jgi:hypothetical protein